jgi:hypothetical protein
MGGQLVPGGIHECLPEPEYLFYRSAQGNELGKNQVSTIL